jgi:hypothetical protein
MCDKCTYIPLVNSPLRGLAVTHMTGSRHYAAVGGTKFAHMTGVVEEVTAIAHSGGEVYAIEGYWMENPFAHDERGLCPASSGRVMVDYLIEECPEARPYIEAINASLKCQ